MEGEGLRELQPPKALAEGGGRGQGEASVRLIAGEPRGSTDQHSLDLRQRGNAVRSLSGIKLQS